MAPKTIPNLVYDNSLVNTSFSTLSILLIENTTEAPQEEGWFDMKQFAYNYSLVHGYISSVVCIFGVISNLLNIIVLTRRHMISPTNTILAGLAIADMLTMLTYLIYASYLYIYKRPYENYNHAQGWMYFIIAHNLFIITCHNMAMWLTVALAVFRYIFVCHHVVANTLCSLQRARLTIIIVMVATILTCVPNIFLYRVIDIAKDMPEANLTGYWIVESTFAKENKIYQLFSFWLYGVVIKVAPCILLTILSTLIIMAMQRAGQRRQRLMRQSARQAEELKEHNRTTMMLIAVVLFFVVTEFPQGILAMISGINTYFFLHVYSNLGDIMDLLVLLNSAVNFILYCIMSQQFRDTFRNIFVEFSVCPRMLRKSTNKQNGATTGIYTSIKSEITQV